MARGTRPVSQNENCFDAMERYELLFEYAGNTEMMPPDHWNDENIIHGCQSRAHVECGVDELGLFRMRGEQTPR